MGHQEVKGDSCRILQGNELDKSVGTKTSTVKPTAHRDRQTSKIRVLKEKQKIERSSRERHSREGSTLPGDVNERQASVLAPCDNVLNHQGRDSHTAEGTLQGDMTERKGKGGTVRFRWRNGPEQNPNSQTVARGRSYNFIRRTVKLLKCEEEGIKVKRILQNLGRDVKKKRLLKEEAPLGQVAHSSRFHKKKSEQGEREEAALFGEGAKGELMRSNEGGAAVEKDGD